MIVNMSVWRDAESLHAFAFESGHVEVMKRRREWFQRMAQAYLVLWWVPAGHIPTVLEAVAKLEHMRAKGPSVDAFHFGEIYSAPDADGDRTPFASGDTCPA